MRVHPNHQFKKRIFINHPAIEVQVMTLAETAMDR